MFRKHFFRPIALSSLADFLLLLYRSRSLTYLTLLLKPNSLTLLGHDQSSSFPFWRSTTPSCLPKTGETPLSMSAWRKSSPVSHLSTTPQREHWHWPPPSTARSPDIRNPSRTWCWLSQPTERSMDTRLRRIWRALFEFACVIINLLILCFTFQQKKLPTDFAIFTMWAWLTGYGSLTETWNQVWTSKPADVT